MTGCPALPSWRSRPCGAAVALVFANVTCGSVGAMPPEVTVGQYEHDPNGDAGRATCNHVQTAGHAANREDDRERE
jgi:hypothetical protein